MAAVPSIGRATRVELPSTHSAAAATDLYERYAGQIFGYCLHQLRSREEAEDAVQTTFMNAFRGLQRGIVPELESAWLFKIAQNVCLSRRRSSSRRGRIEAPNNFEVLQEVVPGREQVADELIRVQEVLEEMPENQRRAILLREWQGLTYREISDELGLSQAAVETLIFRARRALAQGLEQDADTWKKRLRRGADAGSAIACVKALLGGGGAAAIKLGATAAVVAGAAVAVATAPVVPSHEAPQAPRSSNVAAAAVPAPTANAFARPAMPLPTHSAAPATAAEGRAVQPRHAAPKAPRIAAPAPTPDSAPAAPTAAPTPPAQPAPAAHASPKPEPTRTPQASKDAQPAAAPQADAHVPPQNDHQPGPPPQAQGAGPPAEKPDKPDNGHPKADA